MNMETGYELNVPVGDGNKDVKAIISNNEVIWERAIPTPKSGVAPLSFRATRAKPLLDWSITGKTYQAWTPSPEPQIGNNKLDNSKIEKSATVTNFAYTDSSVSFGSMTVGSVINSAEIKSEDTSYAFSFTGDTNKVTFALRCYNSSHTYLGDANKIFDESNRAVMTTLANTAYVRLYITTTVQGNVSLTNLMLNKGNTVMAFEPFGYLPNTGICYVQGVGDKTQNLFDKNNYTQASDALKFKCDLVIGSLYTVKNYSDKPIIVKISNNRDGYSSVEITYQPMESSTFVMTKHPNIPQSETQYIFVRVDGVWVTDISQLNGIDIMINEGTEPLPYEHFGYKITVVNEGVNLFNKDDLKPNTRLGGDGQFYTQNGYYATINYIPVSPNKVYSASWSISPMITVWIYDKDYVPLQRIQDYSSSFVVPSNGRYIRCSVTTTMANTATITRGSTPLPYTPYRTPTTTPIYISSPLMADEQLKSDGIKNVKWGEYVLTGYESYQKNDSDSSNSLYYTNINIPDFYTTNVQAFCSHLVKNDNYEAGTFTFSSAYRVMYLNFGLAFMESIGGNSTQALTNYIKAQYNAGTPITIYYTLIEPKSETIDVPEILTFKGNNVININTEVQPSNVSITYLSSGFEPQPLKTADGQTLYTNNNQPLNTLE